MEKTDRDDEFGLLVEKIRRDVEARCGCSVYSKRHKYLGYSLQKSQGYPPYVFANIFPREKYNKLCEIQSEEKWAIDGGVDGLAEHNNLHGWHDRPCVYWYVIEGDDQSYHKAIKALSKICQAR